MRLKLIAVIAVLFILFLSMPVEAKHIFMAGRDVTVEQGQTVENVVVVGGQATISGLVEQNVIAVGGSVVLTNNAVVRGFAERNAINAPIQGSSADMIKIAMIRIHEDLSKLNIRSKMILQVHDELVFDVHKSEIEVVKPIIHDRMKHALPLDVPIEVELDQGENWLEAH